MKKIYIVKLSADERSYLVDLSKKLAHASQKRKRAEILVLADVNQASWTDAEIARAVGCRMGTVERVRKNFVLNGLQDTLEHKKRLTPPTPCKLDGEQEVKLIALRLGPPPKGYGSWSLGLLASQVVELGICSEISHETVRRTLKKRYV